MRRKGRELLRRILLQTEEIPLRTIDNDRRAGDKKTPRPTHQRKNLSPFSSTRSSYSGFQLA